VTPEQADAILAAAWVYADALADFRMAVRDDKMPGSKAAVDNAIHEFLYMVHGAVQR